MDLGKSKNEPEGALNAIWNVHTIIDHPAGRWTNVFSTIYGNLSLPRPCSTWIKHTHAGSDAMLDEDSWLEARHDPGL